MKKVFYLLASILLNTLTPATIYAQSGFAGGNGSKDTPFLIETELQLGLVRDHCTDDDYFRLIKDITLTAPWTAPIGDVNNDCTFKGHFHGGNHKISGLNIKNSTYKYVGLFGYNKGTIDSLYITGEINGNQYVGGLAGYNEGTVIFCHTDVKVSGLSLIAEVYAGGLAGYNKGNIQSSSSSSDNRQVSAMGAGAVYSGGLVGYNDNGNILNCYAKYVKTQDANIESSAFGNGTAYSGGLAGYSNMGVIENCYTTGTPSANSGSGTEYEGAVVGRNDNGSISNCFYNTDNTSNMPATGDGNNTGTYGSAGNTMKTNI
jgi:hypothetical protein